MTERLSSLLHAEADVLDVPAPATGDVLAAGRRVRRRRRLVTGLAGVAALAVVATGVGVALDHRSGERAVDPGPSAPAPAPAPVPQDGAFSVGRTVYVDGGKAHAEMPEIAQTLYYTSAGVLVRTNRTGASDGGAPFHFQLVTKDGTAHALDLTLGEVVPSTDPAQPYLAWSQTQDGQVQVVLLDVRTGDRKQFDVPDAGRPGGGWASNVVSLSGDHVYVGSGTRVTDLDWRTGETSPADLTPPSYPEVRGGHAVVGQGRDTRVVDVVTGEVLLSVDAGQYGQVDLSPDGRFLTVQAGDAGVGPIPQGFDVYDVATGDHVQVAGQPYDYGWAPDDHLFKVAKAQYTSCDPGTGSCTHVPLTDPVAADVRLAGRTYES